MKYELFVDDGKGQLLDARCQPVYRWEMDSEFSRVDLKDAAGRISIFTRKS